MTIEVISGPDAFKLLKENSNSKYPEPNYKKERLFPYPVPECQPSFKISKESLVFTMGSCFAREVDNALLTNGFEVVSRSSQLSTAVERTGADESLYNKYTIQSITNEIRWALDPETPYPGAPALISIGENNWYDPQLGGQAFSAPLEKMLEFRKSYCESISKLKTADVFIVTLGLIEAWYDKESELYLNIAPHPRAIKKHPNRFEVHVLEYEEVLNELHNLHGLVTKFCKPDLKILITVSPVPLLATFRDQDVLVANTYSKAVQRAAVEKAVRSFSNMDYFPSYEFVTLGNPNHNWTKDYRHVSPHVVQRIMGNVMSKYTEDADFSVNLITSEINYYYAQGEYNSAIETSKKIPIDQLKTNAIYRVGLSFKQLKKHEEALKFFVLCLDKDARHKPSLQNAINISGILGDQDMFSSLIERHEALYPEDQEFRENQTVKHKTTLNV
jgi:tetratricopeptide (TPR) repeat protein